MNTIASMGTKTALQHVVVIGTGLVGTSIARARGDRDMRVSPGAGARAAASLAAAVGAGDVLDGSREAPADLAVLAVPPAAVAATLQSAQKRGLARAYTDVASVKAG